MKENNLKTGLKSPADEIFGTEAINRWCVVVQYAHENHERGDVLSKHDTYELAVKAAKRTGRYNNLAIKTESDLER